MKNFLKMLLPTPMSQTERQLRALTDRDLLDIGINRDDIERIARETRRV